MHIPNALSRAADLRQRVYAHRPLPLCKVLYKQTFEASVYGAVPDSGENALPGIQRALDEAVASGCPARVLLSPGRYDLYPEFQGTGHCLTVNGADGLVIEGNGALLVIHNPLAGWLKLDDCRNVLIRHLEVDYQPLPFTQGVVSDFHPADGTFDLRLDNGYSAFDEPHWALLQPNMNWQDCSSWGMLKHRTVPGRLKPGCPNAIFARGFHRLADRLWRIQVQPADALAHFEVGDRYVHLSRPESPDGAFVWLYHCEHISFINILSYASPSWCYTGWHNSHLSFLNYAVRLKEGRWHTLDSDGINTAGGRVGPWIEDCLFEAGADDTFVSAPAHLALQRVIDSHSLQLGYTAPLILRPGDTLLCYNPREGLPLDQVLVEAVDYDSGVTRFASTLPELTIGKSAALTDRLYNLSCLNNNLVIRGCTVRNSRRWPVWIYTPAMNGALVEHNTFEGCDSAAIKLFNDVGWDVPRDIVAEYAAKPEPTVVSASEFAVDLGHVLVTRNLIDSCAFNSREAVIHIEHPSLGFRPSPWPMVSDVVIAENTIRDWCGRYAISLANTSGAYVTGNEISNQANLGRYEPAGVIHIAYSKQVTLTENRVSDNRSLPLLVRGTASGVVTGEPEQEDR